MTWAEYIRVTSNATLLSLSTFHADSNLCQLRKIVTPESSEDQRHSFHQDIIEPNDLAIPNLCSIGLQA